MNPTQAFVVGALVSATVALTILVWFGVHWARKFMGMASRFEQVRFERRDGSIKSETSFKE